MVIMFHYFFLLPNKTTNIYALAFSFLKTKCDELYLNLNLTPIVADFEESIHAGTKTIWSLIQIIGCRFQLRVVGEKSKKLD